jgi:hypothetical protein
MKCKPLLIAGIWIGLFYAQATYADDKSTPAAALAQSRPIPATEPDEKTIARIQKLLDEVEIETKDFKDKTPLAKFFATLEAKLPKDKKLTFQIDKQALGADFAKAGDALVKLAHGRGNEKTRLRWALGAAVRQLPKEIDVDYAFRGDGILLTRPKLATHRETYDIRDIVACMPSLRKDGLGFIQFGMVRRQAESDDVTAFVRLANNGLDFRSWESMEILNRTRLAFIASPARHDEMRDLLTALRRLCDIRVVMNARLYEVDSKFYKKEIAPLFAKSKKGTPVAPIQPIVADLFKKITRQTMLVESEENKILEQQNVVFLSRQSSFQYAAEPPIILTEPPADQPKRETQKVTDSDLEGVIFEVTARIGPDRRFIQVQVTQNVSQLIRIDKTKLRNPFTGNEMELESPNLRKSTITGTVKLPDGHPILMPVEYRPPGKGKEDKVWLLLARPFIWIEEEVKERREDGKEFNQKTVWDSEVVEEKPEPSAKILPADLESKQILQAIIKDVLTNPKLEDLRDFYGSAKDKAFALVDTDRFGWSKEFEPAKHGFRLVRLDPFDRPRRVLGIRIEKFDLTQKEIDFGDTPVEICLFEAGGEPIGFALRGCTLHYIPKRVGMEWKVECASWESQ